MLNSVSGRRRTPPRDTRHYAQKGTARTGIVKRYRGTCRTDRCRWAASCSPAGAFAQARLPATKAGRLNNRSTCARRPVRTPRIARLGKTPRREVERPGCGSPAARLTEDNARLRPRHARHSGPCEMREFGTGPGVPEPSYLRPGVCRSADSGPATYERAGCVLANRSRMRLRARSTSGGIASRSPRTPSRTPASPVA